MALQKWPQPMELPSLMKSFGGSRFATIHQKESRIFDIFSFQTARYTTRTPCIDWFGAGQTFSAKEMRKAWKIVQVCFLHLCFYSSFLIAGKENPSCARGEVAGVTCGNLGNSSDLTLADGGDEAKGE